MLHRVAWYILTDVSEELTASIISRMTFVTPELPTVTEYEVQSSYPYRIAKICDIRKHIFHQNI
jgi:hypothetical protein